MAIYGADSGPLDGDARGGFRALKGRLPFPIAGRAEIQRSRRPSAAAPPSSSPPRPAPSSEASRPAASPSPIATRSTASPSSSTTAITTIRSMRTSGHRREVRRRPHVGRPRRDRRRRARPDRPLRAPPQRGLDGPEPLARDLSRRQRRGPSGALGARSMRRASLRACRRRCSAPASTGFFFAREEPRMHVHVSCPDGEAKFWLEPLLALATHTGLGSRELARMQRAVEVHHEAIVPCVARALQLTSRFSDSRREPSGFGRRARADGRLCALPLVRAREHRGRSRCPPASRPASALAPARRGSSRRQHRPPRTVSARRPDPHASARPPRGRALADASPRRIEREEERRIDLRHPPATAKLVADDAARIPSPPGERRSCNPTLLRTKRPCGGVLAPPRAHLVAQADGSIRSSSR